MKLRNKKTGEIEPYVELIINQSFGRTKEYSTLKEFCEEWEDYTPKEPLIKDEKIRKAVRAWAEANDYDNDDEFELRVYTTVHNSWSLTHTHNDENEIHFNEGLNLSIVRNNAIYTIAELCGEKE